MADLADKAIAWIRQQKSIAPDKPFFVYFAPGATHAPHHVPAGVDREVQGQVRPGLGRAARGDVRAPEGARRHPARVRADRAARGDPGVGRHGRRAASRCSRGRWRSTPAFLEYADHHVGRVIDALADLGILDDTLIYYIIGDNGASAEGTLIGTINEMMVGEAPDLATPELADRAHRRPRHAARVQPLRRRLGARDGHAVPVDQAGRLALRRHAQRHDRPLAAAASTAKGEIRNQFHHVIDVAPTVLEAAGLPAPTMVNGVDAGAAARREHGLLVRRRDAAERHETQYFEMMCNRGIYHKGWTAVTRHGDRRGRSPGAADRSTTTSGSSTTRPRTGRRRTISPPRCPRSSPSCKRLFELEATQVQRVPARRPRRRALQPRDRRPPERRSHGNTPAPVRRHAPPAGERRHQHQEQVALGDRRGRDPRRRRQRRDRRAGRQHGRLGLYAHEGRLRYYYNFTGAAHLRRRRRPRRSRPARTRCGWSSPTTAAGSARAATSRSTSTATRSARDASSAPTGASSRWTRPPRSARDAGSPVTEDYGPRGNAFTGKVKWVQIDIDAAAVDQDHLIDPEERFRLAMAKQ